ncbi:hypothetical protein GW17_00053946, partial [Ensete ventricosum]
MGRGEEPTVKARLPQNPCAPWGPSFSFVVRSPVRRGGDHDHVGKRPYILDAGPHAMRRFPS